MGFKMIRLQTKADGVAACLKWRLSRGDVDTSCRCQRGLAEAPVVPLARDDVHPRCEAQHAS